MSTFLIPVVTFVTVILIVLLGYGIWSQFFDEGTQDKKQRLQTVYNTVHWGGQSPSIAHAKLHESAIETWLRSHFKPFVELENLAQRAHSPLTAGRLVVLMLLLFTVVLALGFLAQANLLLFLVFAIALATMPVWWLFRHARKRRRAFESKLAEALDYISRALRAGNSLTSALGMVGKEFPAPLGQEFKIVSDEIAFGIPFKVALNQLADRVQSDDLNFFVISLSIQHETGGNLTELLDGLAKTIRERFKLRGIVRTLSSEGRISALILGSMPFVVTAILTLINPGYMSILWTTPQGHTLLMIIGGLMTVGFFVLNRMSQIKV